MGVPYAEVIGDPITHSKSPVIHKFWLTKLGIEADYRAIRVRSEELPDYLATRRFDPDWRGCNVTLPHKKAVLPLLDECRTGGLETANCVVAEDGRLIGHNTDTSGVGKAICDGVDTWAPVCLIGTGGAATAAIAELDVLAVYRFNLIARDRTKVEPLVRIYGEHMRVFGFDAAADAMQGCLGLINATPLGMIGFDPMPETVLGTLDRLDRSAFVFDMVYAPIRTELLQRASAMSLRAVDGLTMLIGQAEDAFSLFFEAPPPSDAEAELRRILAL